MTSAQSDRWMPKTLRPAVPVRRRPRLMIPREHGAYAELLFPIVAVLLGGVPTRSAWLFTVAVIACFVANEPLLVISGHRGTRASRDSGRQARRVLGLTLFVAVVTGGLALWYASTMARTASLIPMLLGALLATMASRGLERRLLGETLAALALSSVAIPLGLMTGLGLTPSVYVAAIWFAASLLGTSAARLTIAGSRAKTEADVFRVRHKWAALFLICVVLCGLGVLAPMTPKGPLWILAAILPVALATLAFSIAKPSASSLRLVGWGLVSANLCTLAIVVFALRIVADIQAVKSTLPFPMF
ncbi:MAG: YwiC-like family protein [Myxococcota bacterium]